MTSELPEQARGRVELAVRRDADSRFLFLVNRTDGGCRWPVCPARSSSGGTSSDGTLVLAPRDVAVLRQPAAETP